MTMEPKGPWEMIKILAFSTLLVLGVFAVGQVRAADDLPTQTAVMLVGQPYPADKGWRRNQCSGTVIAPEVVLTAKHCLNAAWRVRTADGVWHEVYGGKVDPVQDAAVIYVRGVACPCAPIGGALKPGDPVRAVGFPEGEWQDEVGKVIGVKRFGEDDGKMVGETLMVHSALTWFGASGGGLWAMQGGRWVLVGLHSRLQMAMLFIVSWAVPVTEIEFLRP